MYRKSKKEEFYTRKAKEEGYPARSVYKLKEIDDKYKIFNLGDRVLDLGCAPGSWMMYIGSRVGGSGKIVGVDTEEITIPLQNNMRFIQKSMSDLETEDLKELGKFQAVVSDLSPKTSGIKSADAVNSIVLADKALAIAKLTLRPARLPARQGGNFVCKIFEGELSDEFFKEVKKNFEFTKRFRPKAVSKDSREIYIIGMGFIKHA